MYKNKNAEFVLNLNGAVTNQELNHLWQSVYADHQDRDFTAEIAGEHVDHVIARLRGELIGFAKIVRDGGQHAFLLDPIVTPLHQRKGLGREMIMHLVDHAKSHRARYLHVDFTPENEGFYQSLGFEPSRAGIMRLRDEGP